MDRSDAFALAQEGYAKLKVAVYAFMAMEPDRPLSNAEIGRSLGIYAGHLGHVGHIPRTILEELKNDGLVEQSDEDKKWRLVSHRPDDG